MNYLVLWGEICTLVLGAESLETQESAVRDIACGQTYRQWAAGKKQTLYILLDFRPNCSSFAHQVGIRTRQMLSPLALFHRPERPCLTPVISVSISLRTPASSSLCVHKYVYTHLCLLIACFPDSNTNIVKLASLAILFTIEYPGPVHKYAANE